MARQAVGAVGVGGGLRGAGAQVGAALLLGHRHARRDAGLGGGRPEFRVVFAGGQQRLVDLGQLGVVAQRGHHGIRHRNRADVPRFDRPHRGLGGPHDVRTRPLVGPGRGVHAVFDRRAHQLVVRRVVFDLVDPVTVAVVGVQDGPVAIGELAPALRLAAGRQGADLVHLVQAPLPSLANQGLDEHRRGGGVVVFQGGTWLVTTWVSDMGSMLHFSDSCTRAVMISAGARRRSPTVLASRSRATRGRRGRP